jgi:hypothetical protein
MCGSMPPDVCCVGAQNSTGAGQQVRLAALVAGQCALPIPAEWIRVASW